MEEDKVNESLSSRLNRRPRQKVHLHLLGLALMLSLAMGSYVALDHLVPRVSGRVQGFSTRLSWYLQSGQSRADVRTLAAMFRFLVATESDTETFDNDANLPVAGIAAPNHPNSRNTI
jgi:hypothetical protein